MLACMTKMSRTLFVLCLFGSAIKASSYVLGPEEAYKVIEQNFPQSIDRYHSTPEEFLPKKIAPVRSSDSENTDKNHAIPGGKWTMRVEHKL